MVISSSFKSDRPSSDCVYKACTCAEIIIPSTVDTIMLFPLLSAMRLVPLYWGS